MPQRLRRVGTASAAVSAGVLVLVLATPAQAAAAPRECPKGVDPESTIENWKCNLANLGDALAPKTPTPTPTPKPTRSKAPKASSPSKKAVKQTSKARAAKPRKRSSPSRRGPVAGAPPAPSTMTDPGSVRRPQDAPPSGSDLPDVLPPDIAVDPAADRNAGGTAALPQTRLVSPAAASPQSEIPLLLVAAAAGAAGAVGGLNVNVAARALRRRRAAR